MSTEFDRAASDLEQSCVQLRQTNSQMQSHHMKSLNTKFFSQVPQAEARKLAAHKAIDTSLADVQKIIITARNFHLPTAAPTA